MGLTKNELDKFYNKFIEIYTSRDPKRFLDLCDKEVSAISGASDFIMYDKEYLSQEFYKEVEQVPEKISITTLSAHIQYLTEDMALYSVITNWIVPMGLEKLESIGRIVFLFRKINGKLKILHISVSAPLSTTKEGEHFPVKEYEERARQLQQLVDQRTEEILLKEEIEKKLIKENAELFVKKINQEKEILNLELNKLRMELKFKENELVSYAMNLASKNDCFIILEENFKCLTDKTGTDLNAEINKILTTMRSNISIEKEWENFQIKFSLLNQEFINNLSSICPFLSKTEINICSMLKLQIEPKDIARFKYVSVSNIQNHIFRIRKKLNLNRKDNLVKFLLEL